MRLLLVFGRVFGHLQWLWRVDCVQACIQVAFGSGFGRLAVPLACAQALLFVLSVSFLVVVCAIVFVVVLIFLLDDFFIFAGELNYLQIRKRYSF